MIKAAEMVVGFHLFIQHMCTEHRYPPCVLPWGGKEGPPTCPLALTGCYVKAESIPPVSGHERTRTHRFKGGSLNSWLFLGSNGALQQSEVQLLCFLEPMSVAFWRHRHFQGLNGRNSQLPAY